MIPGMSQPPNHTGPVQSDPYASVHRQHHGAYGVPPPGHDGYAHQPHPPHPHHHVVQYVHGPPGHAQQAPHDMMYSVDTSQQPSQGHTQAQAAPQEEEEEEEPLEPSQPAASTNGKRKQPDSATADAGAKKRRARVAGAASGAGEDGEEGQDLEVGPNGGAKHWTEEEKTRFFTWMLMSDEHWDAFKTRMNTVFRECSAELFPGRKSYTALKSCYHRNLEVFKQIHAFQHFSASHFRQMQTENPHVEQPSIDAMLEIARSAGLNVGNLNVKVIDRWYETGWFNLFKRRYREDPKTGLPTPYYGPPDASMEPGSSSGHRQMMGVHTSIDPQLMASHGLQVQPTQDSQYAPQAGEGSQQSVSAMAPNGSYPYSPPASQSSHYREAGSSNLGQPPQPFKYLRSQSALPPRNLQGTPSRSSGAPLLNGQRHSPFRDQIPGEQFGGDHPIQIAHAIAQLTAVTESLIGVCSSVKELLQQNLEESKARTELMRAEATSRAQNGGGNGHQGKEREKEISMEKVTFATEILKNGPQNEEIKKAAIECLTKYLMRDL
ncbi:hypothetical protein BD311DRAFT_775168 [Dichomitus squalens]|uniref:Uncharacterized protein n=1 Tax=Dichomitus squalens TaxID=114155 RepID=A0A4Q9MWW9_9APHY|nr:hypothetical protein BD311DRAFT_775168 [Dichomitus squalens]